MPDLDFICLANSYKVGGCCVAGFRLDGAGWIRPVTDHKHEELWLTDCRLDNRTQPALLDVIRIGCSHPRPHAHQPEN